MELSGNEKRIRALYSDLKLETEGRVPSFGSLWPRTMTNKRPEVRRPIALLVAFSIVAVACAFPIWSWYSSTAFPPRVIVEVQPHKTIVEPPVQLAPVANAQPQSQRKIVRRRAPERRNTSEIAMLSSWQSPTQGLMESPTSLVPTSLPQLNQSVKDLESFLPKDNEIMKELK